jgi:ElaB/YqjD/DUF883 family membrane-anchored ribosome-binding protein
MGKSTKADSDNLKEGVAALSELSADALDAVRELVKEVRDETLELVQSGRDQVEAIGDSTETAITDHPYRSVCIALGIGCLIGILISRR